MLLFANSLRELSFSRLMSIYEEANRENGKELAPEELEARQIALSEQAFYQYLRESFFPTPGARYAIWQENGEYVSALRLEPYQDGLLIEALETAPNQRKKGYASRLLCAVQQALAERGAVILYSHVSKRNIASLGVHQKCGFSIWKDYSVYIDGSVNNRAYTLIFRIKGGNSEIGD